MLRSVSPLLLVVFGTVLVVLISPATVHAQEVEEEIVETDTPIGIGESSTESAEQTPERVDYELPYPGMLPDHPLYMLKVIRDGVVKLLINEPIKRARFSLLSGEKRIYAGKLLVEKGKDELAVETIGKGNNYLDEALDAIETVKKQTPQHMDISPFLLQFRSASLKHGEILRDIKPSIEKEHHASLEREQERADAFVRTADQLLKKKQ